MVMFDQSIPHDLQEFIRRELHPGETIVWSGAPIHRFFTPPATASFLFGIPWTAFAIFWTVGAGIGTLFTGGLSWFSLFPLFGVPFILIGLGMLSAPLLAYRKSRRSAYVVTDKRAITFEGGKSMTIRSYPPEKLRHIYRTEKRDGSGDVIIKVRSWKDSDGDRQSEELGFLRVRDAREVERRLKDLADKAVRRELRDAESSTDQALLPDSDFTRWPTDLEQ